MQFASLIFTKLESLLGAARAQNMVALARQDRTAQTQHQGLIIDDQDGFRAQWGVEHQVVRSGHIQVVYRGVVAHGQHLHTIIVHPAACYSGLQWPCSGGSPCCR